MVVAVKVAVWVALGGRAVVWVVKVVRVAAKAAVVRAARNEPRFSNASSPRRETRSDLGLGSCQKRWRLHLP